MSSVETTSSSSSSTPCGVCGDRNGNAHFGGISCVCCRTFFRRIVRLQRVYTCTKGGKCPIEPSNRSGCRACRYRACLAAGLDPKLVHADRENDEYVAGLKTRRKNKDGNQVATRSPTFVNPVEFLPQVMVLIKRQHQLTKSNGPLGWRRVLDAPDFRDVQSTVEFLHKTDLLIDEYAEHEFNHLFAPAPFYEFNLELNVVDAFYYEPRRLSQRSKILWKPEHAVKMDTFARVWSRTIVVYVDWASFLPELLLLERDDQIRMICGRCIPSLALIFIDRTMKYTDKRWMVVSGGGFYSCENDEPTDFLTWKFYVDREWR
ncbi:hypothetical protein M3Y99_01899100 [Aphelenchoides fujianensis]|nr:hypothetical protein M3Y99_01899100 [Aphelenchoides fujianensis]